MDYNVVDTWICVKVVCSTSEHRADLRDWSKTVLEVPNDALKGLPACPYAREAWKQNKVNVIETAELRH